MHENSRRESFEMMAEEKALVMALQALPIMEEPLIEAFFGNQIKKKDYPWIRKTILIIDFDTSTII